METNAWRFDRIVVGVDGSEGAKRALEWAIDLAKRTEAEIVAVHVAQPFANEVVISGFVAPIPAPDWQDQVRGAFQQEWCLPLRKSGVLFRTVFEEGPAAEGLVEVARREGAGLIVTGTRGHGTIREVILGSVSHYVVQHAGVPVVVVPPDRHARQLEESAAASKLVPFPAEAVMS